MTHKDAFAAKDNDPEVKVRVDKEIWDAINQKTTLAVSQRKEDQGLRAACEDLSGGLCENQGIIRVMFFLNRIVTRIVIFE